MCTVDALHLVHNVDAQWKGYIRQAASPNASLFIPSGYHIT